MKQKNLLLCMFALLFSTVLPTLAENYPYRSDVL